MHQISKFFFNLQKKKDKVGLIYISDTDDSGDNMYLKLTTSGCISLTPICRMLEIFDKDNSEDTLNNLFSFIKSLQVNTIIIYSNNKTGITGALLIFVKLCKELDLYCISFIEKPFLFEGINALRRYNNIIDLLDTDELCDIIDERRNKLLRDEKNNTLSLIFKVYEEELNKLALDKFNNQIQKNTIWKNIKYFKNKEDKTNNVLEEKNFIRREESTKDFEIDYYNRWASENLLNH